MLRVFTGGRRRRGAPARRPPERELAVRQHPPALPLPRAVDPGRHPVGGVRAEQPRALGQAQADHHRVPDECGATARCSAPRPRTPSTSASTTRSTRPSRALGRLTSRSACGPLPGRIHHRPHRHLGGRHQRQRELMRRADGNRGQGRPLFQLSLPGRDRRHHAAAFHECSGLGSTIDVIEHREGGKDRS